MKKTTLHFAIVIYAPRAKVWDTMLKLETYQRWTDEFAPGSTYEGSWEKGAKIRFGTTGGGDGMVATIAENRKHEFVSIQHLGLIQNGVEDTTSEAIQAWLPAFENYRFSDQPKGTELRVDIDIVDEYKDFMEETWPKALAKLKALCEAA